ncbi:MAG TPA: S-layer homology domain-containing protein [Anaerolineales bacterium]|nr:S-layer homology domain-containing protein [Anaerolineales bacterium]
MIKMLLSVALRSTALFVLAALIAFTLFFGAVTPAQAQACQYWIAPAPAGNNANPGTNGQPWATLAHAASRVHSLNGANCIVWVKDGAYNGSNELEERFSTMITFKAVNPYKAIFQNAGVALEISGGANMTFEGFEFRHTGPGAGSLIVSVSQSDDGWAENIVFHNNVFHDSYNNDILKISNGSRFITVENNVFYNQGDNEQHIDINSVTDVTIQDNIFFNDYAGSGRPISGSAKHFIVIKDSNDNEDGLLGAQRITVRRNIFMHYEGDGDALVQVGNDGKPFHEANEVRFENNLIIGNNTDPAGYSFGVSGAKNVSFVNNTVAGNFPSSAYAYRIVIKDQNPLNQNITFYNNIWSDPTRTMEDFSSGDASSVTGFVLNNNLYWNGGSSIPSGDVGSPMSTDTNRVVGNPLLNTDQSGIILPRWNGSAFPSGNATIRQEFYRLVALYGQIAAGSAAIDKALPAQAPATDILGQSRGASPDMGAFEFAGGLFADVPPGYWSQSFIEELYDAGITGGCLAIPLMYCPEANVNRAEMAVFLLRGIHAASYAPPGVGGSTGFGDVPPNYWAAAWIKQLAGEGITAGCSNDGYCPEATVTRAQMAVFLLRSKYGASYSPPGVSGSTGFGDVPPDHWAAAWIKQLVAEGITAGCATNTYCPEAPVTRAQMAVFLVRTFNLP